MNKKLSAHIGKLEGLFARLCVLWHCVENARWQRPPLVVTEDSAQRVACFIHDFLLPHTVSFYVGVLGITDGHEVLTAIAGYILAHSEVAEVTFRTIQRGDRTAKTLTRDEGHRLLERLEYLGWLQPMEMARNGTASRWRVNERVRELFAEKGRREATRRKQAREALRQLAAGSQS